MSSIKRPTAAEWHEHLTEILENQGLSRCDRFPNNYRHIRFTGKPCPQCQLDALQSVRELNKNSSDSVGDYHQADNGSKYQITSRVPPKLPPTKPKFSGIQSLFIALLVVVVLAIIHSNMGDGGESVSSGPTKANRKSPPTSVIYDAVYLNNPAPNYPVQAYRDRAEGTVLVRAEVLPNGQSGQVELDNSSGFESLDKAAISTVKKWRFKPATVDGRAIVQWVTIPVTFRLKKTDSADSTESVELSVAMIQQYLRRLGFDPGPVDGVLGPQTRRAIEAFNISRGLTSNGLITSNFERELQLALGIPSDTSNTSSSGRNPASYFSVYTTDRGGFGGSVGLSSQREADAAALTNCRQYSGDARTCKKWFGGKDKCIAITRDSKWRLYGASGGTESSVIDSALESCREKGGRQCKLAGSTCG